MIEFFTSLIAVLLLFPAEVVAADAGAHPHGKVAAILVVLYDLARRHWPTEKPASLFRDIYKGLHQTVTVLGKIDRFMDHVLGQNVRKVP